MTHVNQLATLMLHKIIFIIIITYGLSKSVGYRAISAYILKVTTENPAMLFLICHSLDYLFSRMN